MTLAMSWDEWVQHDAVALAERVRRGDVSPAELAAQAAAGVAKINPAVHAVVESFVKTLKRDYAKLADRPDSQTVMTQLPKWFDDYNSYHPHSALGYVPPKLYREKRAVN